MADPALRPAFYYAMGNTLVAENMDQAARIAYGPDKRFRRVVTLQVRACGLACAQHVRVCVRACMSVSCVRAVGGGVPQLV